VPFSACFSANCDNHKAKKPLERASRLTDVYLAMATFADLFRSFAVGFFHHTPVCCDAKVIVIVIVISTSTASFLSTSRRTHPTVCRQDCTSADGHQTNVYPLPQ
jgi:hypothetical protein